MELEKYMRGSLTVIALNGQLDSGTAGEIQADLGELVPETGSALLDLSRMTYMSSAGLRVLLLVYRKARETGVRLVLCGISGDVRDIMTTTGFLDFFQVADSVDEGVEVLT